LTRYAFAGTLRVALSRECPNKAGQLTSEIGVDEMSYRELKRALIDKLAVARQAVEGRAKRMKKKYGPMSTEEAIELIAHLEGLDVSKYLDSSQVEQVRRLVHQRAILESPEAQRRATATVKVVNVTIGGKFKLSDPLLPKRVLEDAKAMANVYAEMYVFENSVREVIKRALLRTYGDNWWDDCIPLGIRRYAQLRMDDDEKNAWHGRRGDHPVYYVDISHYISIIQTLWSDFEDLFPSQSWIVERIDEIARSRNVVDHHNPLRKADQDRIKVFFADWFRQIESVKDRLV